MKKSKIITGILVIVCFLSFSNIAWGQETRQTITANFSYPDKPGKVKLSWKLGDVVITGTNENKVSIYLTRNTDSPLSGMKILKGSKITYSMPVEVFEEGNEIDIRSFSSQGQYDIEVLVPAETSIRIDNAAGDITVTDKTGKLGEIEARTSNGMIELTGIAGPVTANTQYGKISAQFISINHEMPMSFRTMNDDIVLELPKDTKAEFAIRTQGTIATDMELEEADFSKNKKEVILERIIETKEEDTGSTKSRDEERKIVQLRSTLEKAIIEQEIIKNQIKTDKEKSKQLKQELLLKEKNLRNIEEMLAQSERNFNEKRVQQQVAKANYELFRNSPIIRFMRGSSSYTLNGGGIRISVGSTNGNIIIRKK
jgi:hypothetical protein